MKRLIFLCCFIPGLVHAATQTNLANGTVCLNSQQCASGVCQRKEAMSLARCAPKAQLGEACSVGDALISVYYNPPCETGLACVSTDTLGVGICVDSQTLQGECPSGYIEVDEPHLFIGATCNLTKDVGTAKSCLAENPSGNCIMYIPVGMSVADDIGTYEYIEPCAFE